MKKTLMVLCLLFLLVLPCLVHAEEAAPDADGRLYVEFLENPEETDHPLFFQITLDAEGNQVAFFSDGILYDVVIEFGTLNFEGTEFVPEYVLFSADTMDSDMLVLVNTYFSDAAPNFRISYIGKDGPVAQLLTQSGEDSSLILMNEE